MQCLLTSTRPHLPCSRRKVPGVGKVTQRVLDAFALCTGADLLAHRRLLGLEVRGGWAALWGGGLC